MTRIVVVDDEHDLSRAMKAILESEGYEVILCSNGREALDALQKTEPRLVLLDVMMPFMGGLETLDRIRAEVRFESLPVVLMNNVEPRGDVGPRTDYLRKPFDSKTMLAAVERCIAKEL